jgi:magnesium chelatase subunit D
MTLPDAHDHSVWGDAMLAAMVFAVDPAGLTGISVKAGAGPVRDRWLAMLLGLLPPSAPVKRVPVAISDSRLLGGLDLSATLQAGRPVAERGLLAEADGGLVLLSMAERIEAGTVAKLSAVLDSGEVLVERDGLALRIPSRFGVVAFDESATEDEHPHPALLDRLAFHLDLDTVGIGEAASADFIDPNAVTAARDRLAKIVVGENMLQAICGTALALGVRSLRPSILALRAARAIAAIEGRDEVRAEDAANAARLVLAPRATILPVPPQESPPEQTPPDQQDSALEESEAPPPQEQAQSENETGDPEKPLDDVVLAAAQAAIPAGLLAQLRLNGAIRAQAKSSGAGALKKSARRGRPLGVRKGELKAGARLNLIETLRAAAPWQVLRRRDDGAARRIHVRPEDFRIARMKQRTETTTIFAVDASGSSALNRLAEAKGAVELLLAECYIRRDKVALVAFRGRGAELLLPPTRSLVRAKRCLANLPGGGGTPLADGMTAAAALADSVKRQGGTPVLILMTDGSANVGRGGKPGRAQAQIDATSAATAIRAAGLTALLVDTSPRAQAAAGRLAKDMGAAYLPLPAADAAALSRSVRAVSGPAGAR